MGLTVQIHPDNYRVVLFDARAGGKDAFAVVKAFEGDGEVSLFMQSAAACDALITAAVEAKRLLLGVPLAHEPVAPRCTSQYASLDTGRVECTLEQDHPDMHAAYTPEGTRLAVWDDEPDPPEPGACTCGHPGYEHIHAAPQPCTRCECKAFTAAPSRGVMFGPFDDAAVSMA